MIKSRIRTITDWVVLSYWKRIPKGQSIMLFGMTKDILERIEDKNG